MTRPRQEQLVLRTYQRREAPLPDGERLTRRLNLAGAPFAVFCLGVECLHYLEGEGVIALWSEDCPLELGTLRCPECGAPVVRPRRNPQADPT